MAALVVVTYGPLGFAAGEVAQRIRRAGRGATGRWGSWLLVAVYLVLAARLAVESL